MSVQLEQNVGSFEVVEIAEARLMSSAHPALRKLFCQFNEGVLVLRGRLNSFFHTQLAQEAVAGIEGVELVVNKIEVAHRTI